MPSCDRGKPWSSIAGYPRHTSGDRCHCAARGGPPLRRRLRSDRHTHRSGALLSKRASTPASACHRFATVTPGQPRRPPCGPARSARRWVGAQVELSPRRRRPTALVQGSFLVVADRGGDALAQALRGAANRDRTNDVDQRRGGINDRGHPTHAERGAVIGLKRHVGPMAWSGLWRDMEGQRLARLAKRPGDQEMTMAAKNNAAFQVYDEDFLPVWGGGPRPRARHPPVPPWSGQGLGGADRGHGSENHTPGAVRLQ